MSVNGVLARDALTGRGEIARRLRWLLKPHGPALIEKAVQLALDGDTTALRLCVDRIIPPIKATEEPVRLDGFDGTLTEQGQAMLANGRLFFPIDVSAVSARPE